VLCKDHLAKARLDPLFNAPHLEDLLDYLSDSSSQWPLGPYMKDPPFAWSYTCPETGALQPSPNPESRSFDPVRKAARERDGPELLFLNGHPSSAWLNAIGHKYNVDMRFFQQHLRSIKDSVHGKYAEPSLPSSSRHTLKLSVPTLGTLFNALEDISKARLLLAEDLRDQFPEDSIEDHVGRPIIRRVYLHDRTQYTLLQEVSMCLLGENGTWTSIPYPPTAYIKS